MKVANITFSLLLFSLFSALATAGKKGRSGGRARWGDRGRGNRGRAGGRGDPYGRNHERRQRGFKYTATEFDELERGTAVVAESANSRRLLNEPPTHNLRSANNRKLVDDALLTTVNSLIDAMRIASGAVDAFETDMQALATLVNDTAFDAATLKSTVEMHLAALDSIRSDMTSIQDIFFSIVTALRVITNDANYEVRKAQNAMEGVANDSQLIQYLISIVEYQQEASNLEGTKEELETLVAVLAIEVDNLTDYDDVLDMFLALSGDANVHDAEHCVYDPYGDCTFTNGYCDDGYEFFAESLTVRKNIPLSGNASSVTVNTVSSCGHHFGNDGFDVYFNGVSVGMISEGTHCTCDPPMGSLTVSNLNSTIPPGSNSFELEIVSKNTQGYIAEAFAQVHYGETA